MSLNRSGVFIVDFEQGNGGWVFGFEILCHKSLKFVRNH